MLQKVLLILFVSFTFYNLKAQETNVLLKEAYNFELKFKDEEALAKYKQVLINEPNLLKALVKATELSCAIGARTTNKNDKRLMFESALAFAQRAVAADNTSADAYYALALANGKMTEVETENKKIIGYVKEIKMNADNALSINAAHALANFIEGKWHFEMVSLNWAKKLAVKALYGGLPTASLDQAAFYLEKSRKADPYFVLTYLTLAKVYKEKTSPTLMIEVLEKLVKLPKRTLEDASYIEEGKKMLEENQ